MVSGGHVDLGGRNLLVGRRRRDVDVRVVVHLVALPQALDDAEVVTGCFRQAVLQDPAL